MATPTTEKSTCRMGSKFFHKRAFHPVYKSNVRRASSTQNTIKIVPFQLLFTIIIFIYLVTIFSNTVSKSGTSDHKQIYTEVSIDINQLTDQKYNPKYEEFEKELIIKWNLIWQIIKCRKTNNK